MLPVALSALLPSIPKLMRPLVAALKSGSDDLVMLGLRTLEVWVDSLNPEFLEPAMAEVVHSLMAALWALLRPVSGHYAASGAKASHMAMQLLGKLGGRSRRFLKDPWPLEYRDNPEHGLRLILTFKPNTSFLVPLDKCVLLAKQGLYGGGAPTTYGHMPADRHDVHYRRQVGAHTLGCTACMLNACWSRLKLLAAAQRCRNTGHCACLSWSCPGMPLFMPVAALRARACFLATA